MGKTIADFIGSVSAGQKRRRLNSCFMCRSFKTRCRILSEGGVFDEVSCIRHIGELEKLADAKAPGVQKIHTTSTGNLTREATPEESAVAFMLAECRMLRELGDLDARKFKNESVW